MKPFLSNYLRTTSPLLSTESGRRLALDAALKLAEHTPLAPDHYEQCLLQQFVKGILSLDQIVQRLEKRYEYT